MASSRMPVEFCDLVSHHLPPEQPVGPQGGRPCAPHRIVLQVIWFVLATGCRWEDARLELGCSGRTAHRRLRCREEDGIWDRLPADLLVCCAKLTNWILIWPSWIASSCGPSGVAKRRDRALWTQEKRLQHTLLVDRHGVPLAIQTAAANASD
jgi:transposase